MKKPIAPDDRILSETEVRQVIRRAALLQADSTLSVAQLKQIARELDITPNALSIALHEILATPGSSDARPSKDAAKDPHAEVPWQKRLIAWFGRGSTATWGLLGSAWGVATAVLDRLIFPANLVDVPSVVGLIVLSLIIAAASRQQRSSWQHYIKRTLPIWLGFMIGWAAAFGEVTPDLVFGVGLIAAATLWVGTIAVRQTTGEEQVTTAG